MRLSMSSRLKPNTNCVRSLVPKLKKSASSASSSARNAARGVSIIVPMVTFGRDTFLPLFIGAGRVAFSRNTSSTHERARASSSRVTVRGIMTSAMGLNPSLDTWSAASMSARTCIAYRPGLITPSRTPRVPIIGLNSAQLSAASNNFSSSCVRPTEAFFTSRSSTRGKNSCNGGSSKRTVTGRPDISRKIAAKSSFCTLRSSSRAAVSSSGVSAKIMRRTTGKRSGAKNMCSVRHKPIPSAPSSRAFFASSPVSAFARTASLPLRISSAHFKMISNSFGGFAASSFNSPTTTSPDAPSSEMTSPSLTTMPPTENCLPSMRTASAPTMAGVPQPRATTAAWLTRPPRAVRMPCDTIMPCTSSGLVSLRTKMTASPRSAASAASSAVK